MTKAAPPMAQSQKPQAGRSRRMTAAATEVASGKRPATTPPCAAGRLRMAKLASAGQPQTRQRPAANKRARLARSGKGRRSARRTSPASTAARPGRATVTNHGSRPATASRVIGKEPPKTSTPSAPSRNPRVCRDIIFCHLREAGRRAGGGALPGRCGCYRRRGLKAFEYALPAVDGRQSWLIRRIGRIREICLLPDGAMQRSESMRRSPRRRPSRNRGRRKLRRRGTRESGEREVARCGFTAFGDEVEVDLLSFGQRLQSRRAHGSDVNENILAAIGWANEAVTLGLVEPLDRYPEAMQRYPCRPKPFKNSPRRRAERKQSSSRGPADR